MLDYGCGPSPVFSAAFSPISKQITLAEYEECHRDFLEKWIRKDPSRHDCSHYMKHRAGLYGGSTRGEQFEEEYRYKVSGPVSGDVTKEQFIEEGHEGHYDIVFSSLCLENPCQNLVEYRECMKKLVSLVKENGYFIISTAIRENSEVGFFIINNVTMYNLTLKSCDVVEAIKNCGLQLLKEDSLDFSPSKNSNVEKLKLFIAQKL